MSVLYLCFFSTNRSQLKSKFVFQLENVIVKSTLIRASLVNFLFKIFMNKFEKNIENS